MRDRDIAILLPEPTMVGNVQSSINFYIIWLFSFSSYFVPRLWLYFVYFFLDGLFRFD